MPVLTASIPYGNNGFSPPAETRKMKVKVYNWKKHNFFTDYIIINAEDPRESINN